MKKTLLFVAMLCMTTSIVAQAPKKSSLNSKEVLKKTETLNIQEDRFNNNYLETLDSVRYEDEWNTHSIAYKYDWKGRIIQETTYSEWGTDRVVNNYDPETDLLMTVEGYSIEDVSIGFEHFYTEIYTYNEARQLILFEYNALNFGEWGITDRYEYEYDAEGRLVSQVTWWYDFFSPNPQLVLSNKEEIEYGENSYTTTNFYYSSETESWVPSGRTVNLLTESGLCISSIQYRYDYETGELISDYKDEKALNENGLVASITYSRWENDTWNPETVVTAEYNDNNQLISLSTDEYRDGELYHYLYNEYEYDGNGNRSLVKDYYYNETEYVMTSFSECIFELETATDAVMGNTEIWKSIFSGYFSNAVDIEFTINNKWTSFNRYEYGEENYFTSVTAFFSPASGISEDNPTTSVNAIGLVGKVSISCEEPTDICIYDMAGRVVAVSQKVTDSQIELKAGSYIVKAGNVSVKVMVR